jgi:hypothetical protein
LACADVVEYRFACSGTGCAPGTYQYASYCDYTGTGAYDGCFTSGYGLCCSTNYQRASGSGECRRAASISPEAKANVVAKVYPEPTKLYVRKHCRGAQGYAVIQIEPQPMSRPDFNSSFIPGGK